MRVRHGAAVAAAFLPDATPDTVIEAATAYLLPVSARRSGADRGDAGPGGGGRGWGIQPFREAYYARHLYPTASDSRETVPATLALFRLAEATPSGPSCTGPTSGATRTPSPPWSGGWRAPCTACRGCRRVGDEGGGQSGGALRRRWWRAWRRSCASRQDGPGGTPRRSAHSAEARAGRNVSCFIPLGGRRGAPAGGAWARRR